RRALLAEGEIAEPDVLEQLQRMVHPRMRPEELDGIVHIHRQHVADALLASQDGQRLRVETAPAAHIAQNLHVREKAHLDGLHALAFAGLTAPAGRVEREAARGVAANAGFGGPGIDAADLVPEADVGGGAGAWRLADGCLVDFQNTIEVLETPYGPAAHELGLAAVAAV